DRTRRTRRRSGSGSRPDRRLTRGTTRSDRTGAERVMEALSKLRRFVEPPPPKYEKCELCGAPMESAHRHVVDLNDRRLMCTCRPCYLLFTQPGAAGGKLRSVPERYAKLSKIDLAEIPVGVVFFIRDSASNRVKAFYPSPAGATESSVS